jgi:UDPglucose--hexose-1-phosphate uridylyltransferase
MKKSELRQDLVSKDWILIAPGRAKRPDQYAIRKEKRKRAPKSTCPFENPQKSGNKKPVLVYHNKHSWELQIIENKYPALRHARVCALTSSHGPYLTMAAAGHHDVLITRDHDANFPRLSERQALQVFQAFRDRYLMLSSDECMAYLSIFHNWGPSAGASIYHPHYQLIALPIVPPDVWHSLLGSLEYYASHKICVHCAMLEWERKEKKRIVYENEGAIVVAPFVSRQPFEIRVFPKKHLPYFENTLDVDLESVVDALREALRLVEKKLGDPDYNFFIHTAPLQNKLDYKPYHWHIEIFPKISTTAGFELGTGIEINVIDPDIAAKILKS